jgi:broad specificity phosphatase PhoE
MKLILMRHGESEANANNILQGRENGKLTFKGAEQARKAGKELKEKYKIDMVFCSPLKRAVETLENILVEDPIEGPVYMCKLLEERDFGEYSGVNENDIDWKDLDEDNKINKEMGLESLLELLKRTNLFLEDLKLEEEKSTVLVVAHSELLKMIVSILTGKPFKDKEFENAEIMEFEIVD